MGKKKKCNPVGVAALCILMFLLGMLTLFVLNNFTTANIYKFVSCKYNKHSCETPNWDGVCTQQIRDKCCIDVRLCEGDVGFGPECLDKYCIKEGETCEAVTTVYGFECKCVEVI